MVDIRSWKVWVIFALALGTLACANREERRERKEQAREERRERAEARRAERLERNEARRPARETRRDEPKVAESLPREREQQTQAAPAASFTPTSTAPASAVSDATIVFIRVFTASGGMIYNNAASSIFDVTDGAPKIVGILRGGTKLSHPVKPGQRTFMVIGETADFMQATIVGGKTYYALVMQRSGFVKARYSFRPVRGKEIGGKQFARWDDRTRLLDETPEWQSWASSNTAEVTEKHARHWPEWSGKSQAQRAAQTLNAEDGR